MPAAAPFPNCLSGLIGLAIAGDPENDGHLSRWQEAVGHARPTASVPVHRWALSRVG
jgi:hypothetical protein